MGLKTISIQMYDSTIEKVDEISKLVHLAKKGDVIKVSVEIAKEIAEAVTNGGRIFIENKDKTKSELIVKDFHEKESA